MSDFELTLIPAVSDSFLAQKAKNSVDLTDGKCAHKIKITDCDFETPWNVGLIVGASGSGKSTIANYIFGEIKNFKPDFEKAVIDQFPHEWSYEQCVGNLTAIGLSQVPCWVKPFKTLSNGQQERARIVLTLAHDQGFVFDEWTSVVDRNVAAIMSHTVQKFSRKNGKKIVLISCHYDVAEWLDPDWVIDCNDQLYIDRRNQIGEEREKKISFDIRPISGQSWRNFSKYHYLSDNIPGGLIKCFGLFLGKKQIGFQCFAEYTPWRDKSKKRILHFNRTVIHPDYVGFGLGMKLINETSKIIKNQGYRVMGKYSSLPVFRAMIKDRKWKFISSGFNTPTGNCKRSTGFRQKVKFWSFEYIGI